MTPLYALLLTGTHILAVLAGACAYAKWPRTLPRNSVLEPVHVDSEAQIVVRYRTAEGA